MGTVFGGSLSTATEDAVELRFAQAKRRRAVFLVFGCTILGAAAQVLIKTGANSLANPSLIQMLTSVPLLAGYSLYGISMALLVWALRHGELSILYPVIALTYVWVSILSVTVFHEEMNLWKLLGIGTVVAGVTVLGRGQQT
jgi:multidrug transporter EmrE-like cation transporter